MVLPKAKTKRLPVTISESSWVYLEELVRLGTHGTSVTDVAKGMIEEGIRIAMRDKFLKKPVDDSN